MGRKKDLNPMEKYRRKQKKQQIAKNKKKRAEAKDKALQRRDAEWIMTEIQKLNRREKQDRGKNEEKYTNQRKKLLEAHNRAIRIQKIKEKTHRKSTDNNNNSTDNNNDEHSPTPPPIEQMEQHQNESHSNHSNTLINTPTSTNTNTNTNTTTPITNVNPIATYPPINPQTNIYNHLYHNPLLPMYTHVPPHGHHSMYSDALGAKSNQNNATQQPMQPTHPLMFAHNHMMNVNAFHLDKNKNKNMKHRTNDMYDPMNPVNPKYNFVRDKDKMFNNMKQKQYVATVNVVHKQKVVTSNIKNKKAKRKIEVIMDPKLKLMMPSSMRFKRKFEKPKIVPAAKKRKLNIAPEVDGSNDDLNKKKLNKKDNNNFGTGNADAAYDKFMDEISGLI